jgi:MGT family glycosyltransferase
VKVLAHTVLSPGHTHPFLAVLLELKRRGFAVDFCVNTSDGECPREIAGIQVTGIRWHGPDRIPMNQGREAAERTWQANLARSGEQLAVALEGQLLAKRPDFLLIDPMLWGSMLAAEASGIPWASLAHNPLTIRGCGIDARGPGLPPARGSMGQLRDRVVDWGMRFSLLRSLDLVNGARRARGLSPLRDFRDRYLTAPLIIAATAEPFEYTRSDWPPSLLFVGPLIWEPEVERPDWLENLDDRPVVLLAGSSVRDYGTEERWASAVMVALADEPLQLIATLPTSGSLRSIPDNVILTPFIPHGHVLPRAACVICHGGFGITAKALATGVPVIAIPDALDRFEVARRVEVAGAGVMLRGKRLAPARLRRAVRTAMRCKPAAERIAGVFSRSGGSSAAASAIEAMLA